VTADEAIAADAVLRKVSTVSSTHKYPGMQRLHVTVKACQRTGRWHHLDRLFLSFVPGSPKQPIVYSSLKKNI